MKTMPNKPLTWAHGRPLYRLEPEEEMPQGLIPKRTAKMLIVKLGADKFILVGTNCHITFAPTGSNTGKAWQYLKVTEGHYENGVFKPLRILNGDETDFGGPRFGALPTVLQTELGLR